MSLDVAYCIVPWCMISVNVIVCEIWLLIHFFVTSELHLWPSAFFKVTCTFIIRCIPYCWIFVPKNEVCRFNRIFNLYGHLYGENLNDITITSSPIWFLWNKTVKATTVTAAHEVAAGDWTSDFFFYQKTSILTTQPSCSLIPLLVSYITCLLSDAFHATWIFSEWCINVAKMSVVLTPVWAIRLKLKLSAFWTSRQRWTMCPMKPVTIFSIISIILCVFVVAAMLPFSVLYSRIYDKHN